MNREELFKRTCEVLNPEVTRRQRVAVIGLGSGGARVVEEIVRFGVEDLLLVDRPGECIEEHNVIRHPLGYSAVGRLKGEALGERLRDINPACRITDVQLDVSTDEQGLREALAAFAPTQIHMCTDNEPSKHVINAAAVTMGVPMIFAGVFDGGCGGEVGHTRPGQACYACIASFLRRSAATGPEKSETFDYSNPENMQQRSTAALNLDIAQIALIEARVGLLLMLAGTGEAPALEGNYILFGNRPVEGLFPRMLHSETWDVPALEKCLICGGASGMTATGNEAESILAAAVCSA